MAPKDFVINRALCIVSEWKLLLHDIVIRSKMATWQPFLIFYIFAFCLVATPNKAVVTYFLVVTFILRFGK